MIIGLQHKDFKVMNIGCKQVKPIMEKNWIFLNCNVQHPMPTPNMECQRTIMKLKTKYEVMHAGYYSSLADVGQDVRDCAAGRIKSSQKSTDVGRLSRRVADVRS